MAYQQGVYPAHTSFASPGLNVPKFALVQKVELRISCTNLPSRDVLSKSDPCAVLFFGVGGKYKEYDCTEKQKNCENPEFLEPITVDYHFESVQQVMIRIYDVDDHSDDDFLGQIECTLGQIVSQSPFSKQMTNKKGKPIDDSFIRVSAQELSGGGDVAHMTWEAEKLDKKDLFGKSDPFMDILREEADGTWQLIHRTEVVKKNLNPQWDTITLPINQMFGNNRDKEAKFEIYDHDDDGSHDFIGDFTVTYGDFKKGIDSEVRWDVINDKKAEKKSKYKRSGYGMLISLEIEKVHSFLDYLFGGLQMNLTFGVDFTASNGEQRDSNSLHYLDPHHPTEYTQAIRAVGSVLQDYDSDKRFPSYGFGAKIPPHMEESYLFPLTFNEQNHHCEGLEHVLQCYANCVQCVELWAPTYVAPIINTVASYARTAQQAEMSGALAYHILLLLTDGVLTDMDEVRDALVEASTLPFSLIIVGVGEADFEDMHILDGDDDGVLFNTAGDPVERDIVQFVPFVDFRQRSPAELASHVLAEVPKQVTSYYKMRGIKPPQLPRTNMPPYGFQ